jgi:transposase InsO family protein
MMCRLYEVTRGGYYAWRHRVPSARQHADERLLQQIERVHADSHGTYGSPRIQRTLCMQGVQVGKNRVARLMRKHQIHARAAKLYRRNPGMHVFFERIPKQRLQALSMNPNAVWVGDITYLKLGAAWRYLATVMDRCTRRVVGWNLSPRKDVRLTLKALDRAVHRRRPRPGLIFHSDRGTEYAGYVFRDRLAALGIVQSMNERVNDNAHMESFYHSMKSDVIHGVAFERERQLHRVVSEYIRFYNERRIHSSLGYVTPAMYEQNLSRRGVN